MFLFHLDTFLRPKTKKLILKANMLIYTIHGGRTFLSSHWVVYTCESLETLTFCKVLDLIQNSKEIHVDTNLFLQ